MEIGPHALKSPIEPSVGRDILLNAQHPVVFGGGWGGAALLLSIEPAMPLTFAEHLQRACENTTQVAQGVPKTEYMRENTAKNDHAF